MESSARNKGFVAKGGGFILLIAIIAVLIWFIVRKANNDAHLHKATTADSTAVQDSSGSAQPTSPSSSTLNSGDTSKHQ